MDVIKAPNLIDAVLLGLVFFASFFLANTWTDTFRVIFRTVAPQNLLRDYIIYSIVVTIFFIIFLYLLRKYY
jgi:hypothetical protein